MDSKIRELCEQIAACEDDGKCVYLAMELRAALHDYVETMRGKVIIFPMSDPVVDIENVS